MAHFPRLVERWRGKQATTLYCEQCERTRQATEDEIGLREGLPPCGHCDGMLDWAYHEADRCKGCGKLGFWDKALGYCCSRRCQLQAEYAATLRDA